jgi:3-hydroxybutyryl-CoA dehydrogenase
MIGMAETVAVLGAGTMGAGIAHVAALAGFDVMLYDVSEAARAGGIARVRAGLDGGVARNKVTPEAAAAALARVRAADDLAAAVGGAAAVIEAVFEDLALKRRIFAEVEAAAPAGALLATNTSSLSVGAIAAGMRGADRLVGMHFFNPVPAMKLVEIVHHPTTDAGVVARARSLAERLGKDPIVVRDAPGFASSRLGVLVGLEAIRMVEQGIASAEDIDKAMKLGYGHPMGPIELGDHVGLDVRLAIAEYLERELGPAFRPPELLRRKVAEGKLGKKSGEGFYVWKK